MTFTLPTLPYAYDALAPIIDEKTMTIHHSKHHQWYIDKLNAALEETDYEGWSLDDLMTKMHDIDDAVQWSVRNNGGGHYNHSLFWKIMTPGGKDISDAFAQKVSARFGSVDNMKELFAEAAKGQFGSGRAWLSVDKDWQLNIENTANQDNPRMEGRHPLLGIDVWEHAYYLSYQNKRPEYISQRRHVVNREVVEQLYNDAV